MKSIFFTVVFLLHTANASQEQALLFYGNCTACHGTTKARSAPSMAEVRKRYMTAFPKKEDFVKQLSQWVQRPNATTSIMQDSIDKYGLMPDLAFEKDVLDDIASYIYKKDFK